MPEPVPTPPAPNWASRKLWAAVGLTLTCTAIAAATDGLSVDSFLKCATPLLAWMGLEGGADIAGRVAGGGKRDN